MQQPVHLPDFIPEDLLQAYGEDARRSVSCHTASRSPGAAGVPASSGPRPTSAESVSSRRRRQDLTAAVIIALPGAVLLSVLWAWLAVTTDDLIWWFPAMGGLATVAVLAATVWRALARRGGTARQTIAADLPPARLHHAHDAS